MRRELLRNCSSAFLSRPRRRSLHVSTPSCRNRLLFEPCEVSRDEASGRLQSLLAPTDSRAVHINTILRSASGQTLRVGVVDGRRGTATLLRCASSPDSSLRLVWDEHTEPALPPPLVDLLLAVPRPKALLRLLSHAAALGVGQITLCGAQRVEPSFYGAHQLSPAAMREACLKGVEQAGDTRLPSVFFSRRFPPAADAAAGRRSWPCGDGFSWLVGANNDAEGLPPAFVLVAHPSRDPSAPAGVAAALAGSARTPNGRVLVAVGPEGGWSDHELRVLMGERSVRQCFDKVPAQGAECHAENSDAEATGGGAAIVSLGSRTLTTETAVIALLAAVKEATHGW